MSRKKRTQTDKLLDALGKKEAEAAKPARTCHECGNTHFTPRTPLGERKFFICTKCKARQYGPPVLSDPLMGPVHGQDENRGPVWLPNIAGEVTNVNTPIIKKMKKQGIIR